MQNHQQKAINKALYYINSHLNGPLDLKTIAANAHLSKFHFHRLFKSVMGETVADYCARRRLVSALHDMLSNPVRPIGDIALTRGYSSSANFARACSQYFGYSPSELRKPSADKKSKIGKLQRKYGKAFSPDDLYPVRRDSGYNWQPGHLGAAVRLEKVVGFRLCTIRSRRGYEAESINSGFAALRRLAGISGITSVDTECYALCYDNHTVTPASLCHCELGLLVNNEFVIPEQFQEFRVPEGNYLILRMKGHMQDTLNARLGFLVDWLPQSGFQVRNEWLLEKIIPGKNPDGQINMELRVKLEN